MYLRVGSGRSRLSKPDLRYGEIVVESRKGIGKKLVVGMPILK